MALEAQSPKKQDEERVIDLDVIDGEEEEERWVKHYSSNHEILLVGEGDFSFSLSLAFGFHSASNIVATSLDSRDAVVTKYTNAKSNLEALETMGATILHGVDATKMKLHSDLKMRKFDRIIYNFPHAGFKGKEDEIHLIKLHRQLVFGFFRNACHMLRPYGQVHVTHKTENPYNKWKLDELASDNSLIVIECADFSINDYPGYNNKRGDGVNCDLPFRLGECCTYKFTLGDIHGKKKAHKMKAAMARRNAVNVTIQDGSWTTPEINHSLDIRYPQADYMHNIIGRPWTTYVEGIPALMSSPPNRLINAGPLDVDPIPAKVYTQTPRTQSSFQQYNFATGLAGDSRFISVPQTTSESYVAGIPRICSPPRFGFGGLSSRAFGDHAAELSNTVRRFGPDFRHAEGFMANEYEPRFGAKNGFPIALRGHTDDIRDIIARYGSGCRHADPTLRTPSQDIRDVIARYGSSQDFRDIIARYGLGVQNYSCEPYMSYEPCRNVHEYMRPPSEEVNYFGPARGCLARRECY